MAGRRGTERWNAPNRESATPTTTIGLIGAVPPPGTQAGEV